MELDPIELKEQSEDAARSRLNSLVAVTIALLATFMGICKVKDDNIVQAMQADQAHAVDQWSYYQAKNTQSKLMSATADQFEVLSLSATGPAKDMAKKEAEKYKAEAARMLEDKAKIKKDAEGFEKDYDAQNVHDDQFDLSDAALALAISLLAVTSLTQKKWLFVVALVPTTFGVVMGVAGLLRLGLHPDALTNLLSMINLPIRKV